MSVDGPHKDNKNKYVCACMREEREYCEKATRYMVFIIIHKLPWWDLQKILWTPSSSPPHGETTHVEMNDHHVLECYLGSSCFPSRCTSGWSVAVCVRGFSTERARGYWRSWKKRPAVARHKETDLKGERVTPCWGCSLITLTDDITFTYMYMYTLKEVLDASRMPFSTSFVIFSDKSLQIWIKHTKITVYLSQITINTL